MIREERLYKVKETHFPLRIFGIIFVSLLLIGALHTQIVVLFNIYDDRLDQYLQVALGILDFDVCFDYNVYKKADEKGI